MITSPEVVIFVVYPLCTLGIAYSVRLGVDKLGSLERKIDRLYGKFGDHQVKVEHRLSNLEAKVNE